MTPNQTHTLSLGPVETLLRLRLEQVKALFWVLLDPDSQPQNQLINTALQAQEAGADALLLGGSFIGGPQFGEVAAQLRKALSIPVILFPGNASQVVSGPQAILFTSLLSGRNPQYLIEEQVRGAVLVKSYQIESLPTAYILIESGKTTAVEYISQTKPIPAHKPALSAVHALAAQHMGMRWVYLEAGSGAQNPVPVPVVKAVCQYTQNLIIVGGGICSPQEAHERVSAGAHVIVVGNHMENSDNLHHLKDFAHVIHTGTSVP